MFKPFTTEEIKNFTPEQKQKILDDYIHAGLKDWYLMINIYKYIVINCFCALFYPMVLYHTHKLTSKKPENIYLQGYSFWPNILALISFLCQGVIVTCWISSQLHGYAITDSFATLHFLIAVFMFFCVSCCYSTQSTCFTRAKNKQMRLFQK